MRQAEDRGSLKSVIGKWRSEGRKIALVPTMGNLHDGHLALVESARARADRVVVSIFVNPAQFDRRDDFERYPRTLPNDLEMLRASGCDLAFVPDERTLYPRGLDNAVRLKAPPDLAGKLEGRYRAGHFDGVVTVVARLFCLAEPDIALFGEKDFQQLLVIRAMVADLGFPVRIVSVPTVREGDGLAISSRNRLLERDQRAVAAVLNQALQGVVDGICRQSVPIEDAESRACGELERAGMKVDYVAVRRAGDLGRPESDEQDLRVLAAAWCGDIRLIDNMPLI